MRIEQLYLKNFRGFEEITIDFPKKNLAVLIGENGSGKTSILDAIAIKLSDLLYEVLNKPNFPHWILRENDMKKGANKAFIYIDLLGKKYSIRFGDYPNGIRGVNRDFHQAFRKNINKSKENANLDVFVYYFPPKSKKTEQKQLEYKFPQYAAYHSALSEFTKDFSDFKKWYVEQENWENRQKVYKQDLDFSLKNLDTIRLAINSFFQEMNANHLQNFQVKNGKVSNEFETLNDFSLSIEKNGEQLEINQLSHGEKHTLLVIADIARRLAIANPTLTNPLNGKGIVLIDEIELHLHPSWQRKVLPALTKTFPNIQFIVTTHSPQVLSSVAKESILILEDFKIIENVPHTKGRDSNSILFDLFGVENRPIAAKQDLETLYKLIEEDKKEEALIQLDKIAKDFGDDDIEVVRANMHIELMGE